MFPISVETFFEKYRCGFFSWTSATTRAQRIDCQKAYAHTTLCYTYICALLAVKSTFEVDVVYTYIIYMPNTIVLVCDCTCIYVLHRVYTPRCALLYIRRICTALASTPRPPKFPHLFSYTGLFYRSYAIVLVYTPRCRLLYAPKNGLIALWSATNRWYVVKCVSQKRNWSDNKNQWYNIWVTFIFKFS